MSAYGSSGGAFQGSSRIPASIARPKRFSSIEYGDRGRLNDRNTVLERVFDLLVAGPDPVAKRRDHAHIRIVRLEGELEAELIVPLAGAAVNHRLRAELESDLGNRLRDDRA